MGSRRRLVSFSAIGVLGFSIVAIQAVVIGVSVDDQPESVSKVSAVLNPVLEAEEAVAADAGVEVAGTLSAAC